MDICVFSSSYLGSGKVSIYSLTVGGVYCLVATVVSPRVYQQQIRLLGDDVPVHLFDMDGSQSTVTNVDSGNRRRLSPHLQLCLVLFCKHPRRLHPHKFAFLELNMSASVFHKAVCTNLKSAPLASFSRLLVDFAILCPGTVQNWTVAVDCSPDDWRCKSSIHALIGSSDWVKVLFIFWCPWQWESIVPTTCSINNIKSGQVERTGKLFFYRF